MKKSLRVVCISIGVAALIVCGWTLVRALFYAPVPEITSSNPQILPEAALSAIHPVGLRIPALGIDAKVQEVGITKTGNMGVPSNFTDVGWYKYGSLPGEDGNAVIAGHVDNGLALPGVFKRLPELKPGDDIYVEGSDGTELHYVMTESISYDRNAKVDEVFGRTGPSTLRLITCTGTWVPKEMTHDTRLVVTAVLKRASAVSLTE